MTTTRILVPGASHLDHEVVLTGHRQFNSKGAEHVEGRRVDNGLFEMIPSSWIVTTVTSTDTVSR